MNKPIPHKLYKYQPFDKYALINLIKRQLYFSKPENFNDPFDCNPPFEITKTHRTPKNIKFLYDNIRNYEVGKLGIGGSIFDSKYLTDGKPK